MNELNEAIGCYIDELVDIKRNKDLTEAEKVKQLQEIAKQLSQEKDWLYTK